MSQNFVEYLDDTLTEAINTSVTEKGAVGFKTSGNNLLDLNFMVSSLRDEPDEEVVNRFNAAWLQDPELALKWLFFARDITKGLGEKRLFRLCFAWLIKNYKKSIPSKILSLIPNYGSWKDIFILYQLTGDKDFLEIAAKQLQEDAKNVIVLKSDLSLAAKFAPSINCSNKDRVNLGKLMAKYLNLTPKEYRKTLSAIRKRLNIVEIPMSANKWSDINYSNVASVANMRYNKAFYKHDEDRRKAFLEKVIKGEAKVNSGVLYPHNIVHMIEQEHSGYWNDIKLKPNPEAEAAWKSYPKKSIGNVLVVADGSGSMTIEVAPKVMALDIANALAIYFAECNTGIYKDKYITFSSRPQMVDLSVSPDEKNPLCKKLEKCLAHNECSNTDIKKVFNLILATAVNNKVPQEDLPKTVLIISDMEFDGQCDYGQREYCATKSDKLFQLIEEEYKKEGYKVPRLVFWNTSSRTHTIPLVENENGVALLSGYSINNTDMVISGELDPLKCLLNVIKGERYKEITLI